MLRVENIDSAYGPVQALRGVSLEVGPREVVCLLGANGAGKTTLLNVISGLQPLSTGRVTWEGERLSGLKAPRIVARGVVQVPEGRQLFTPLTVLENLEMGAFLRRGADQRQKLQKDLEEVLELFPALAQRRHQTAGTLSGGEQQMLAIGRSMMAAPKVLLLDEPSLGLAPLITREILQVIGSLAMKGCAVLLVEQNALGALEVAHRGYLIVNGRISASGTAKELLADGQVQEAYLGRAAGCGPAPAGDEP